MNLRIFFLHNKDRFHLGLDNTVINIIFTHLFLTLYFVCASVSLISLLLTIVHLLFQIIMQ